MSDTTEKLVDELNGFFDWAPQIREQERERWKVMYGCEPKDLMNFVIKAFSQIEQNTRQEVVAEMIEKIDGFRMGFAVMSDGKSRDISMALEDLKKELSK